MFRRLAMLALVLAVSGLVPLMATGGSCADMPCCHHHGTFVANAAAGDCCSPATCAKEEQAVRTATSTTQRHQAPVIVATMPALSVRAAHDRGSPQRVATSPPISTTERLSVLSILLI